LGTALGILAKDGIVLAAERKVTSKLLEQDTSAEKLYTQVHIQPGRVDLLGRRWWSFEQRHRLAGAAQKQ
jgi:hypothetical protein